MAHHRIHNHKSLFVLFALLIVLIGTSLPVTAQTPEPLPKKQAEKVLSEIAKTYSNWGKVELNGKLSLDILPLKASLKIYMQKDKEILISVRAPFIGEAARIEIDTDSLTAVNRLKNQYCTIGTDYVEQAWPGIIPDLQSLLLGRAFLWKNGQISKRMYDAFEVYDDVDKYMVVPNSDRLPALFGYGFGINPDYSLESMVGQMGSDEHMVVFNYTWPGDKKMDIEINAMLGSRTYDAYLSLDAPKWGAKEFERFSPSSKMHRMEFYDFIKNLQRGL